MQVKKAYKALKARKDLNIASRQHSHLLQQVSHTCLGPCASITCFSHMPQPQKAAAVTHHHHCTLTKYLDSKSKQAL